MKTTNSTNGKIKTVNLAGVSAVRFQLSKRQIAENKRRDEERARHWAQGRAIRSEREKKVLADIEIVHEYDECLFGRFGFGYRGADGKIVEYIIPRMGPNWDIFDDVEVNEITLIESLEWIEHMSFADRRFDAPMQDGHGLVRWIKDLHAALK